MDIKFENKRILVTGAASGIGKGIATRLVQCGGTVIALDKCRRNLDTLKQENPSIETIEVDISLWKDTQDSIKQILPVDMLVNCAGVAEILPITSINEESYYKTFDINVKGLIAVTQIVVDDLITNQKTGSIVNISSQASQAALLNHTIYCASKGSVDSFTRALALELGQKNIRVNCVNPTVVMTELGRQAWSDPSARYGMLAKIPLQRFAEVKDVVDAVLFLLSDKASMITGHCLPVDGGFLSS